MLKENAALSNQLSQVTTTLAITEAALKYAQEYVEKQSQQMAIIHDGYTRAIRAKHFDNMGYPRTQTKDTPEWEPN